MTFGELAENLRIAVILCHGGNFAAGIFDTNGICTHHKVISRYVVRAKQGGRQANQDKKFRSAGSWIRTQEEKKLYAEVGEVLKSWDFTECTHIFVFVPARINTSTIYQ